MGSFFKKLSAVLVILACSVSLCAASEPSSDSGDKKKAASSSQPSFAEMLEARKKDRARWAHNDKATLYCDSLSEQANNTFKERLEGVPASAEERDRIQRNLGKTGAATYDRIYALSMPDNLEPELAEPAREAFVAGLKRDCLQANIKKSDKPRPVECSTFLQKKQDFCAERHTGDMLEKCEAWAAEEYEKTGCQ